MAFAENRSAVIATSVALAVVVVVALILILKYCRRSSLVTPVLTAPIAPPVPALAPSTSLAALPYTRGRALSVNTLEHGRRRSTATVIINSVEKNLSTEHTLTAGVDH